MSIENKSIQNRKYSIYMAAVVIYGCLCGFLYYKQLINYGTGLFEADTPEHVRMAVEDHFAYSITAFIYMFLSLFKYSEVLIASFLGTATALSVVFTDKLIRKCLEIYSVNCPGILVFVGSFVANFVMGFYLKFANVQHYIGYQNANMWHNSTYICMRLVAVFVLIKYIDIYKSQKLNVKDWLIFAGLLAVSTAVKPSFLVVFAPAMAVALVIDLIKKVPFKKVFVLGCTVFPALAVMALQSMVLFGGDTGNGYTIKPFAALAQRGDHPKVTVILSILFPLVIFFAHIKDFYKDRLYSMGLLVWLWGFLEVFLFAETGQRSGDGNFLWGYSIALFVIFLSSMIKLYKDFNDMKKNAFSTSYVVVATVLLVWHTISGIWYWALLFTGVTYFV